MEATVPADTVVQSYLVKTKYTKKGVPKVIGLPRNTPSAAASEDSLKLPAVRPRRNNSSRRSTGRGAGNGGGNAGGNAGGGGSSSGSGIAASSPAVARQRLGSAREHSGVGYVGIDGHDAADDDAPLTSPGAGKARSLNFAVSSISS